jgi:CRP/FNR family cyclic AMP-dependent transcriptional regulator
MELNLPPGFETNEENSEYSEVDEKGFEKDQASTLVYDRDIKMVKMLKLRKSEFLKHVDDSGINMLASGIQSRKIRPGFILLRQGENVEESDNKSMYLVKSGLMDIFVGGMKDENLVKTIGRGEIVGERALFLQEVRSASVQARTQVELGEIRVEQVQELLHRFPRLRNVTRQIFTGAKIELERALNHRGMKDAVQHNSLVASKEGDQFADHDALARRLISNASFVKRKSKNASFTKHNHSFTTRVWKRSSNGAGGDAEDFRVPLAVNTDTESQQPELDTSTPSRRIKHDDLQSIPLNGFVQKNRPHHETIHHAPSNSTRLMELAELGKTT